MYEEESPLTQKVNSFQIELNELDDDVRNVQSTKSILLKNFTTYSEEIWNQEQKRLNDQHELDFLQEKKSNTLDNLESTSSIVKKLNGKNSQVKDKLDLIIKAYDGNYFFNQHVKESFKNTVKLLNSIHLVQDQDVNDVRNVGKSTKEFLQLNLEEKDRFYDQFKDLESSDESLDEELSTLDNHLGNSQLENCKKAFSELKKEGEKTIFKSNNVKSTIEQIESRTNLNLDEWNSKWIKEEEKLNEIKRLNEEYLSKMDKPNSSYKNNSNHLESERRRAQSLQQRLEEMIKDMSQLDLEMATAKELQKEFLGVDDLIIEKVSLIFQSRKNKEEKIFEIKQVDDQISSTKDKIEKVLQRDSTLGAELAEIETEENINAHIQQRSDEIVDIKNTTKHKKQQNVAEDKSLKQKVADAKALFQEKRKDCQGNSKTLISHQEELLNIHSDVNKKGIIIEELEEEITHAQELSEKQKSVEDERENYYNLYNAEIAKLQKRQHDIEEAKILNQKLDEIKRQTESRKEETLKKIKDQLKIETDELQKSKIELKSKVDMEKAAMSKIQYGYYTSKNAFHEGQKRLATLRAMNEIAICENDGAKTYLNWVSTGEYLSKYLKKDQGSELKDKDEFLFSQMLNQKDSDVLGTVKGSQDMELDEINETERRIEALEKSQIDHGSNSPPYDKSKFMYIPEKDVQPSDGAVSVVNLISEDHNEKNVFMNSPNNHIQSQCDSVINLISSEGAYERNNMNNAGNLKDFELKKPFPIQSKIHNIRPLNSQNINSQIQKLPSVIQPSSFKIPQSKENRFFKTTNRNPFTLLSSLNKAPSSKSLKYTYEPTKSYDSDTDNNPYILFSSPKHEVSSSSSKKLQKKTASQNSQKPLKKPAAKKSRVTKKKEFDEEAHQMRMLDYIKSVRKSETLKD